MKNKGFTLVELLTIICVLGLIVGIAVPASNRLITSGQENKFIADARTVINNVELYVNENNYKIPDDGVNLSELDLEMNDIDQYNGHVIYNGTEIELSYFSNGSICGSGTVKNFKVISCDK